MSMSQSEKIASKLFPLSGIQEQFWVLGNLLPLDTAYNIPLVYRIKGELNIYAFKSALKSVLDNHEMLRANIELTNNTPFFVSPVDFDLNGFLTIESINSIYSSQLFSDHVLNEVHKPFKICGDKLLRIRLIVFDDITYLSIVFHHIIIDLHSKFVFIKELASGYNNIINSRDLKRAIVSRYADYISWYNNWLLSDNAEKMRAEWLTEFDSSREQIELNFQLPLKKSGNISGKRLFFEISPDVARKITEFSNANNITPFIFLLSSYAIFVSRIYNQRKIVIGIPFSNRRKEEFADTIGCFVNILPVLLSFENEINVFELVKQVRIALLRIHRKQEIPYMELNTVLNRNPQNPLFQVGFTFEDPIDISLDGLEIESIILEREGAQLDLFLTFWNSKNKFYGFWEYGTDKFSSELIIRFNETYEQIIKSMLENPSESIHGFDILSQSDLNLLGEFNNTACDYEKNICLHQKFETQVDKTPDAPALMTNSIKLTYKETDEHINRLANYLISKGVHPGDVIALCCERSIEMMIGIMAILKSGACYLPVQIDNPPERTDEIIRDSKAKLILSSKKGVANINVHNKGRILFIDKILEAPLHKNSNRPCIPLKSNSLAYILYTSGSTGKPKGTLIEHHSVLNRIGWMQKSYPLDSSDVLLQKTPIIFDVSVWEFFWWFFNGSRLVLLNHNEEKDPASIVDNIEKFAVTQIHFVPSMFSPFLNFLIQYNCSRKIKSLRNIFLSGESLPPKLVSEFYKLGQISGLPSIVNLYGPTEATVDVSYYNCPKDLSEADKIYIGKPIDNTCLFIVNQYMKVQPIGVKGELLITGVNLSRGYLNNPELTDNSFFKFTKPDGIIVRAYKTGDIAVLSSCGEIEYLGRIDSQVKLRGMRIELGEIESNLMQHPNILAAVVILAFEGEQKAIIAYVAFRCGECLKQAELREFITTKVPPYMVPAQFIIVDNIPLTSSGKLNRKALPEPEKEIKSNFIIKPCMECEMELLKLWQDVLNIKNISVTDNFFDIGGNSLLALKLAMMINDHFSIRIAIISVFEHTNIREFSKYLAKFRDNKQEDPATKPARACQKRINIIKKNRINLN